MTMDCKITVSWYYYYMYWYRQLSSGEMILIINLYSENSQERKGRYSLKFQKPQKLLSLTISSLTITDSAVYFCAVRSTGTWWDLDYTVRLIFGRGTKLIVEPKTQPPSSPSVFVMKNGTNVACLVKDFYPKDVNISLQSSKKIKEIGSAIVISPSKKYSAVKLGQYEGSSSVTCSVQHNNKIVNSADFEPNTNLSDNPKPTEAGSVTQATQSYREPKVYAEKVNMMSLTVLGLRMLFAKSVAINFLLTAKLFFS